MTEAFAMLDENGEIDPRTVHPTERGAKVNAICVRTGTFVSAAWTDEVITGAWERLRQATGYRIVPVKIEVVE